MNKIINLFYFIILLQFSSLLSSVHAGPSFEIPKELGYLSYEEIAELLENLKLLAEMGIKLTKEQLIKKAKEVESINNATKGLWEAKLTFQHLLPIEYQQALCGTLPPDYYPEEPTTTTISYEPYGDDGSDDDNEYKRDKRQACTYKTDFDVRTKWPKCVSFINNVVNQGQCGSCWAVSSASAFSDCYCIERAKKGLNTPLTPSNTFSALDVLTCAATNGCKGNRHNNAFNYMRRSGVCTGTDYTKQNGCKPYPFPPSGKLQVAPACSNKCTNTRWGVSYPNDKKFVGETDKLNGEEAIIEQLKSTGPVTVCFDVYSDFNGYKTGVYFKTAGAVKKGAHAVVIVGYGTQDCEGKEIKYWIIRNSWGKNWGEEGFVKFRRGENECRIEENGAYAIP
ncbi:Pept_C1 domain-containing protein [Meloidogyne graminicola]|uniref:Pept_C1 domain-containing protein n=1 Tax=Meloidogyne graminicola TaxID=189291 RepID=A0A8S9ZLE4_9BILA|nr:Pept_C1 domain-containing protein [Meloidogyne graminicola]